MHRKKGRLIIDRVIRNLDEDAYRLCRADLPLLTLLKQVRDGPDDGLAYLTRVHWAIGPTGDNRFDGGLPTLSEWKEQQRAHTQRIDHLEVVIDFLKHQAGQK